MFEDEDVILNADEVKIADNVSEEQVGDGIKPWSRDTRSNNNDGWQATKEFKSQRLETMIEINEGQDHTEEEAEAMTKLKQAVAKRKKERMSNIISNETMELFESSDILNRVYSEAIDYPVEHNHNPFK